MIKIKAKKIVLGLLCVVLLVCSFMAFTAFTPVKASTDKYFSAEEYTDNEALPNYDDCLRVRRQ